MLEVGQKQKEDPLLGGKFSNHDLAGYQVGNDSHGQPCLLNRNGKPVTQTRPGYSYDEIEE